MNRKIISRISRLLVLPMVVTTVFSSPVISLAQNPYMDAKVAEIGMKTAAIPFDEDALSEDALAMLEASIGEDEPAVGDGEYIDEEAVERLFASNPDFEAGGAIVFENLDEIPWVSDEVLEKANADGEAAEDEEVTGGSVISYTSSNYIPECIAGGDAPNYSTGVKDQSAYLLTVSSNGKVIKKERPYSFETCWSFSSIGAMETSYNLNEGISGKNLTSPDLSERALVYFTYNNDNTAKKSDGTPNMDLRDPLATTNNPYGPLEKDKNYLTVSMTTDSEKIATAYQAFAFGGSPQFAVDTFAQGVGPTDENKAPYSISVSTNKYDQNLTRNLRDCSSSAKYSSDYYLKSARFMNMEQKEIVKKNILRYGSVVTMIYYASNGLVSANLIRDGVAYPQYFFHRISGAANHAIQIVGWDDDIEATVNGEKVKGAWLCRNTYGKDWKVSKLGYASDGGYFWISYATTDKKTENTKGETDRKGYAFEMEEKDTSAGVLTNRLYQYDGSVFNQEMEYGISYANIFTAANPKSKTAVEYLRSVLVKVASPGSVYSVQLYENPETDKLGYIVPDSGKKLLSSPVMGVVEEAGYYEVDLGQGIALTHGAKVAVVVNLYEMNVAGDYPKLYRSISGSYRMVVDSDKLSKNDPEGKYTYGYLKGVNTSSDDHSFYKDKSGKWHDFHKDATGSPRIKLRTVQSTADEGYVAPDSRTVNVSLNFDANGGTCATSSKVVTVSGKMGSLPTPTKYGYNFAGWYTDKTSGKKLTADSECYFAYDKTIYAHWTPKTPKVSFDANEGYTIAVDRDVVFDAPYGEMPKALRNKYYEFAGWFTAKEGGSEVKDVSKVAIEDNHTLYAHWNQIADDTKVEQIAGGTVSGDVVTYDLTMVKGSKTVALKDVIKKVKEDGRDYTVTSTDKRIATATKTGKISAKRAGECTITIFKPTENLTYNLNVTVTAPAYAKRILRINTGELVDLNFAGTKLEETYSISTRQQRYAKVYSGGIVEGLAKGKAVVTVAAGGKKYKASVYVYNPTMYGSSEVDAGRRITLKVKNGYGKTTWSVEDGTGKAEITQKGRLKGLEEGTVTVVAVNNGRTMRKEVVVYD